ncbi:hypothetical protein BSKO_06440 [Bryopsis sp. KO-2023]|nr:hypothetical protein BSKO_06440 [Bryopsis sp. KO-2023]
MSGTFDALPDACVHEILKKSDEATILRFQATCKRYLSLGRAASLWRQKLEQLCGFKLPQALSNDSAALARVVRAVLECSDDPISFSGVSTDGGMYSERYWLDNVFREGRFGYCTGEDADHGVFCIAAHETERTSPGNRHGYVSTVQGGRSITCNDFVVEALGRRDNEKELVVVRRILVNRSGQYSCPVASGGVSLGHVNWRSLMEEQASPINIAVRLHQEVGCVEENKLGALDSMESVLKACQNGELQPEVVSWGGNGEWIQFCGGDDVSRPVIWFHFFNDEEYERRKTDGERERRWRLTGDFQKLGAVCQTVELELQNQSKKRSLFTDSRNQLDMVLTRPAVGSVAFINLNTHEQIDETARGEGFFSASTNIDIQKLKLAGSVVDLMKFCSQQAD